MGDFAPNPGSRGKQGALNKLSALFKRLVVVNFNAAPAPPAINGAMIQIVGADGAQPRLSWDSFGSQGSLFFRRANTSLAAPTALQANDAIGVIQGFGYGATAYSSNRRAQILCAASENWTDAAQGTYWAFYVAVAGSTTVVEAMRVQTSGGVSVGDATFNTTDPGAGNLAVKGAISAASINASAVPTGATYQSGLLSPTAPNSTVTTQMQGLAGAITPTKSGKVMVTISGTVISSVTTHGVGILYSIRYGTGAAPGNNTAVAGTGVGGQQEFTNPAAATAAGDIHAPFSISAVITGLTLSTAYWLDLAALAISAASQVSLSNVSICVIEL
jgi:hypothetical protein